MDFSTMMHDPAAFRRRLVVRTRDGDRALGDVLAPFQLGPLAKLDAAAVAMAGGRPLDQPLHLWVWSKGSAKTTLASITWLWLLLFSRDPVEIRVAAGKREQASETLKVIRELVSKNLWLADVVEVMTSEVRLRRKTDSRIVLVSTDDLTGHGGRPTGSFIDELSHLDKSDEAFVDMLLGNYVKLKGPVLVCSNAGVRRSWQHRRVSEWERSGQWQVSTFAEPAPWIASEDIRATGISESRIRRWFYSEWLDENDEGLKRADVEAAVRLSGPVYASDDGWVHSIGIDTSSSQDATAVVVARKGGGRSQVIRALKWLPERGRRLDMEPVEDAIVELYQRYQPRFVVMDNQGSDLVRCRKRGLPVEKQPVHPAVQIQMAVLTVSLFASGSIDLFPDNDLINDFAAMRIEDRPSLGLRLSAPRGREGHGDVGIAAVYALFALRDVDDAGPWIVSPTPERRADRSFFEQVPADAWAVRSLAPAWCGDWGGTDERDRPFLTSRMP